MGAEHKGPLAAFVVIAVIAGVLLVNLAVDIALAVMDPRSTIRES